MQTINIQFTLFSAFYTPLIATMSAGFLREEGLHAEWSVSSPGVSAIDALLDGSAHVVQSAPSQGITAAAAGRAPKARHFAQINEMDGFFLAGREAEPDFDWQRLEGARVVLFGGGQPLAMFRYACYRAGIDFERIEVINVGGADAMDKAFRNGQGDYVQQQGPYPQALEADGVGHVVAQVGPKVGLCAFSSLAALPEWLETDAACAFTRAYRRARAYMNETPAAAIAQSVASYFDGLDPAVLTGCIASYQQLGCWSPHIEITPAAYEATLDIYDYNGPLVRRPAWDEVCVRPPDSR